MTRIRLCEFELYSRQHELHDSQLCHDELCELFFLRICVPEDAFPLAIHTL